jgi:hypothetical protein
MARHAIRHRLPLGQELCSRRKPACATHQEAGYFSHS